MKKELDYFTIEGCYGGNQDWFTNLVMHMGGCAAATHATVAFISDFRMKG